MKLERTKRFKQDYKREAKGRHRKTLDESFIAVLEFLISNKPLAENTKTMLYRANGQTIVIAI